MKFSSSASPTIYFKPTKLNSDFELANSMGAAFQLISQMDVKVSRNVKCKVARRMQLSYAHNDEFMEVIELVPVQDHVEGIFYAPDDASARKQGDIDCNNIWNSSDNFKVFRQTEKHQLVICSVTKEENHENLFKTIVYFFNLF